MNRFINKRDGETRYLTARTESAMSLRACRRQRTSPEQWTDRSGQKRDHLSKMADDEARCRERGELTGGSGDPSSASGANWIEGEIH
jgi:hypothetical protein